MNRYVLVVIGIFSIGLVGVLMLNPVDSGTTSTIDDIDSEITIKLDPYEFEGNEYLSDSAIVEAGMAKDIIEVSYVDYDERNGFGESILADVGSIPVSSDTLEISENGHSDMETDDRIDRVGVSSNINSIYEELSVSSYDIKVIDSMARYFKTTSDFDNVGEVGVGDMRVTNKAARDMAKRLGLNYKEDLLVDDYYNRLIGVSYYLYLKEINSNIHFVINAYIFGPSGILNVTSEDLGYETEISRGILSGV